MARKKSGRMTPKEKAEPKNHEGGKKKKHLKKCDQVGWIPVSKGRRGDRNRIAKNLLRAEDSAFKQPVPRTVQKHPMGQTRL